MRAVVVIVLLALAAYFAYNQFVKPLSEEEQMIKDMDKQFNLATRQFIGGARMSGTISMDPGSSIEEAVAKIKEIRDLLRRKQGGLKEEKAVRRAADLEMRIAEFCRKNDIM